MKKIKIILPVIAAGAILLIAGCSSDRVAEGAARRGSGGGGRVAAAPLAENYDSSAIPVSLTRIEGTLSYDDPEWYLDTGNDVVLLHLGNRAYLESLDGDLEEGGEAVVTGIMEDDGISVVKMITDGGELAFRSESGVPFWAGNGNRSWAQSAPADGLAEPRGGGSFSDDRAAGDAVGRGRGQDSGRGAAGGGRRGPAGDTSGTQYRGTGQTAL